jgi:hypothetical protein
MGTYGKTVPVDYRISFANQGIKLQISDSVCSKQTEVRHLHFPNCHFPLGTAVSKYNYKYKYES